MTAPRKPGWKPDASASAPASPSAGKPAGWKPSGPTQPSGPSWISSRWVQVGGVLAGLFALAGVLIYLFFIPRPVRAPALVLIEAGYEANLAVPHNVAGRNATKALEQWAIRHGEQVSRGDWRKIDVSRATLEPEGEEALKKIEALKSTTFTRPVDRAVIYVAAHGVALPAEDGTLTAYLVPEGFDPANPSALFKFDRLLDALASLPKATQKLLLLDTGGVRTSWALGQFQPTFVAALESERYQDKIKAIDNLSVITAAGRNQPSWVAEEQGLSAFALFTLDALAGAADSDPKDGVVTAYELHTYLSGKVAEWSRHNRARLQQPALYPAKDEGVSRARALPLAHFESYTQADLPAPRPDTDLAACTKSWERARELAALSPWSHAPHRWRRYQELLIRAEELARAGDTTSSERVRGDADKLAGEIAASREAAFDSMRLSIPMLESLGVRLGAAETAWLGTFSAALDAGNLDECVKMASAPAKEAGPRWVRQAQRLRATERVLRHIAADPGKRGPACKALLAALDDALEPNRPGEAQYLTVVLDEKAPPAPADEKLAAQRWTLIGKALLARLRAEEAALGMKADAPAAPEAVMPWVRPAVTRADRARRTAQDLLFTTLPERWAEAEKLLAEAEKDYITAEETARYVLRAMRDCHSALARLPHLSRWLAEQTIDKDAEARVEAAWVKAHNMHLLLQAAPPGDAQLREAVGANGKLDPDKLAGAINLNLRGGARLNGMLDPLAGDMAFIEGKVKQSAADLADPPTTDVSWHRIDAYLRLPLADPALRSKLARDSARISHALHADGRKAAKAGGAENTDDLIRAEAAHQARFAVAAAAEKTPDRDELKAALERPDLGVKLVKLMAGRAAEAAAKAEAASKADMAKAGAELRRAAALARLIDGWAAPILTRDPVDALRQVGLHDLFCWQAERAYLDHLSGGQAGADGKPYFKAAASRFLADAKRRAEAGADTNTKNEPRYEAVKATQTRVDNAAPLNLEWAPAPKAAYLTGGGAFHLTDEPEAERYYRLAGPADIEGSSVRWASATAGLKAPTPGVREWPLGEAHRAAIQADGDLYKRRKRTSKYSIDAFFRGQRVAAEMAVTIHREPDHLAVEPPPPPRTSVAVLTDDKEFAKHVASKHAICIVLDCSGSMLEKGPDGVVKWDGARKALRDVLYQMPDGVQVSLVVYSAAGFQPELKPGQDVGRGGIQSVWDLHPWKKEDREARLKRIDALKPESATPLMRSIKFAREQLPVAFRDRRSIVVITDGGDYNFYRSEVLNKRPGRKPIADLDADLKVKNKVPNRLRTIADFLGDTFSSANNADDIKVKVIGFGIGKMDEWEERAHKELPGALKGIGGQYVDARNTADLTAALTRNLLRLDYKLVVPPKEGEFEKPPLEGTISRIFSAEGKRENLRWMDVPPGARTLRLDLMKSVNQEVRTQAGDALVLEMRPEDSSVMRFRRWMFIRSLARGGSFQRVAEATSGWTLGAVESWQEGAGRMRSMATLEKDRGFADPGQPVQMIHPSWAWFELHQDKSKERGAALRAVKLYNYPAPAFGMEVPFWPLDEPARLKGWWLEGTRQIASRPDLRGERLLDQQEKKLAFEAGEDAATLESVTLEKSCLVPFRQDGKEDVTVADCLVVRLRYDNKKGPYFAEVGDPSRRTGGVAHRFFHEAGKSTSIFWPVTAEDAERIKELRVYSVAALKAAAMQKDIALGAPASGNRRPQEVER